MPGIHASIYKTNTWYVYSSKVKSFDNLPEPQKLEDLGYYTMQSNHHASVCNKLTMPTSELTLAYLCPFVDKGPKVDMHIQDEV